MSAFDLLTENDKNLIEDYINWFGGDGSSTYASSLETVLHEWSINKGEQLTTLFGNKLILSRPFTYQMPREGLYKEYSKFSTNNHNLLSKFKTFIYRLQYIDKALEPYQESFDKLLDSDTLIDNAFPLFKVFN